MDGKRLALLIGALLLAGVSAFMARSCSPAAARRTATRRAAADRAGGARRHPRAAGRHDHRAGKASATSRGPRSWSRTPITSAATGRSEPRSTARSSATEITAGQPMTQGSLVKPGDRGFLAAALGPGMRAVTVPVSAQTGVARLRLPGRPRRSDADPGRCRRRRWPAAQGLRDDHPQPARARHRSAHRQRASTRTARPSSRPSPPSPRSDAARSPRRSPSRRRSARCRCRCARSPTTPPSSSARSPPARSGCPRTAIRKAEKQMLLQIASRPIDTDTTFTAAPTCRASSAAPCPAKTGAAGLAADRRRRAACSASAAGRVRPRRSARSSAIARGNTVTDVPVGGK